MVELWGGPESTVNRVGDRWRDQSVLTGHHDRPGDLARFAGLGLRSLRYPVLWERHAPEAPGAFDWAWSDARLGEIRRLGMNPVVDLLHHGSGPAYTDLLDDAFPSLFADYAGAVAARYPWVSDWTPVNEPLTTARFSTLMGLWYPHARDEASFWRALLNQIDGTRLAMARIRAVNPAARLVQPEDLGEALSTPPLAAEAAFQNHRRWLTWDLLCGRVDPDHPLWAQAVDLGFENRLLAILEDPCPPDVVGVNHYLTSVRWLDHRGDRFPPGFVNPEGHVDVEAIRTTPFQPPGLEAVLRQAWDRYGLPIAVTESHNGSTRDEQMRWTFEAWTTALKLEREGVDIRAVTAWALVGACDWNSLLTREDGHIERGAFDVHGGAAHPTAMSDLLRRLGAGETPEAVRAAHPCLDELPWWRREARRLFTPDRPVRTPARPRRSGPRVKRRLLITGATGTLGQALAHACEVRNLPYRLTSRAGLDLTDAGSVAAALDDVAPWAVVNAAGWVRVDEAEDHPEACRLANAEGPARLAAACAERGVPCVNVSSDLVFDGAAGRPYVESDTPNPQGAYGRSKAEMERRVAEAGGRQLVVRTAAFFSAQDPFNFAAHVARELEAGRTVRASDRHVVTPTFTPGLAHAMLDLVIDGAVGVRHLSSGEALSWLAFAERIAEALGLDAQRVRPATPETLGWRAPRPLNGALASAFGCALEPLDRSLARFAEDHARVRDALEPAAAA